MRMGERGRCICVRQCRRRVRKRWRRNGRTRKPLQRRAVRKYRESQADRPKKNCAPISRASDTVKDRRSYISNTVTERRSQNGRKRSSPPFVIPPVRGRRNPPAAAIAISAHSAPENSDAASPSAPGRTQDRRGYVATVNIARERNLAQYDFSALLGERCIYELGRPRAAFWRSKGGLFATHKWPN